MARRILIVEDDNDINNLLAALLEQAGYETVQCFSGTEALLRLEQARFDLALLDLMLPGLGGEEVVARLRSKSAMPVIILSAREGPAEKARLLRDGADDYITKPFDEEELLARIEAALRRAGSLPAAARLCFRHLELDTEARTLLADGQRVNLTAHEFDILALLMQNPAKVFTRANIYASVWDEPFCGDDNTVNVHVSNLRGKLGEAEVIKTVWGIGFKLADA